VSGFREALQALDQVGLPYSFRKRTYSEDDLPSAGELDLWMRPADGHSADSALRRAGFHRLDAPGRGPHRFYLAFRDGRWLKLDVKVAGTAERDRARRGWRAFLGRAWRGLQRRGPVSGRRTGPVVAVLGPDGAGKGTLIESLRAEIPVAVTTVYLGGRKRRKPPVASGSSTNDRGAPRRVGPLREAAGLVRWTFRTWGRLATVYAASWRGAVVLCDRHPIELVAVRPDRTRLARAIERLATSRLIPWPDAVVVLDAPPEVLYGRKREHSVAVLQRWREGYREVFGSRGATIVSTDGPPHVAVARASQAVWEALVKRRGW
jgi:thymidylate kinase